jgi:hypothetical protein
VVPLRLGGVERGQHLEVIALLPRHAAAAAAAAAKRSNAAAAA